MRRKNIIKRFVSGLLVGTLVFSNVGVIPASATETEEISISISNSSKIDVALTIKDTSLDLSNFENDIRDALEERGVDASNIEFQTVDGGQVSTNTMTATTIFNEWGRVGKTGNWSLVTSDTTQAIQNRENTVGMTGFYYKDNFKLKDMSLEFEARPLDSDDDFFGIFLRFNVADENVANTSKVVTSYMYIEQKNGATDFKTSNGLYKLVGKKLLTADDSGSSQSSKLGGCVYPVKSGWTATTSRFSKYKFTIEGNHILGYRDGVLIVDYTDESDAILTGSFGFVNWSQPAQFRNFVAEFTVFKDYIELLRGTKWRDNSQRIVVNVDNALDETLTGTDTMGEILSRTLADNVHFIQWGTEENKSSAEDFIARNDSNGTFTYNNDYEQAIQDTAEYIKSLIPQQNDSQYVVVGLENNINVTPSSLKSNAVSPSYPSGRWRIHHIADFYENDEGQSTETELYQPELDCNFDKPGKYEIYFDDELVKEIYAHRAPVADFNIGIEGTNVTLESTSYDLDVTTNNGLGAGIASEAWYYKEATDTEWTSGKLTSFEKNKIFMIRLEVTDLQGVTSSTVKYIGIGTPVAKFNLLSTQINTAETVVVNDTSYDPQGYDIPTYKWVLKKDGVAIKTYTTKEFPTLDFTDSTLGAANYAIELTITNSVGTASEVYTQSFTVETAKYKNVYRHWLWGFTNNEGNNVTKDGFLLQTTYGEEIYGNSFIPNATYALTVPNGFYLRPQFGNSQLNGTYTLFNFGMSISQPAYVMNFQYDYLPYTYSITYNLDGGMGNNNPSEYNVLYGFTFNEPTKKGYDFVGWYDKDGNKLTGVNENCNANFSDTIDLYNKLSTRTTGDIEVTARWELHDYTIDTDYTGSGTISNDTAVTYTQSTSIFVIPAEGYEYTALTVDGVTLSPVSSYIFSNVEADHTVKATFTISQTRKMQLLSTAYSWINLNLN